jgi:hypothetical protein
MSQPKGCTAPPIVFLLFVILFLGGGWLWGNWSGRKSNPANIDSSSNPLPIPLPLGDPLKIDDTELTLPSGVDYRPLRALLRQGKWREADEETRERLKEAAGATGQELLPADVARIRCEDLAIVDRLWSSYSEQRFGLAVQWSVLEKAGMGTVYSEALWKTFGNRVGWRANSRWLEYEETRFERDAPPGHLPRLVFGEAGAVLPMILEANAKQQCGTGVVSVPDNAATSAPTQTPQPLAPSVSSSGLSQSRAQTMTVDRQDNIAERRTIEKEYFTPIPPSPIPYRWEFMGSASTGEEVYVDSSSINKSDGTTNFTYKIGNDSVTARADCNSNRWYATGYGWYSPQSKATQEMLNYICKL